MIHVVRRVDGRNNFSRKRNLGSKDVLRNKKSLRKLKARKKALKLKKKKSKIQYTLYK